MIKPDSYIVIHGWMLSDLKLKGNELLVYAILYGFSQDGESQYSGSIPYLCDWTASTRSTVHKSLSTLIDKGLVQRIVDTPDHSCYQAFRNPKTSIIGGQNKPQGVRKSDTGCPKIGQGVSDKKTGGVRKSDTDNIGGNIGDNPSLSCVSGSPFSFEECQAYITQNCPEVSARKFYTYYQARKWRMSGGMKITADNWKALVQNWAAREGDYNIPTQQPKAQRSRKRSAASTTGLVPSRPLTPEEEAQQKAELEQNQKELQAMLERAEREKAEQPPPEPTPPPKHLRKCENCQHCRSYKAGLGIMCGLHGRLGWNETAFRYPCEKGGENCG